MQLFFSDNTNNNFTLSPEESKHIIKVLRKKEGDILSFTNGEGILSITEITNASLNKTQVKVIERTNKQKNRNYYLHIAIALTKNINRFEWFLEKAVEVGVDRIVPVWTSRSERKVEKHERWKKVLVSAMKQSGRSYLPELSKAKPFTESISDFSSGLKIAHCMAAIAGDKKHLLSNLKKGEDAVIAIGPEGDFTQEEVELALEKGAREISLGDNRLRTETAGIVAVTYFRSLQA